MQTIKIKVKGFRYGKIETVIHKWKTDLVFEDETFDTIPKIIKNGVVIESIKLSKTFTIARNSKIIDYLDNIQFGKIMMDEHDFDMIIDYEVLKPKKKKLTIPEILSQHNLDNQTIADFMHTYQNMKDNIKGLSNEKKIEIVFQSINIAYTSATNAYQNILNQFNNKNNDEINLELLNLYEKLL
jgi:hypothetical protein